MRFSTIQRGHPHLGWCRIAALVALAELVTLSPANAKWLDLLPTSSELPVSNSEASPTRAWAEFCLSLPQECAIDHSEPDLIQLTHDTWAVVLKINDFANSSVSPTTDQDHWGVEDRWDYPNDGKGDCEDIQLLKRKLLMAAGFPRRALRMTVVVDGTGAGHAVLLMRTDRGDFVLDNQTTVVLPWSETGYEFIKREGTRGADWVALSSQRAPAATAKP